jgi:hypothetical protein
LLAASMVAVRAAALAASSPMAAASGRLAQYLRGMCCRIKGRLSRAGLKMWR